MLTSVINRWPLFLGLGLPCAGTGLFAVWRVTRGAPVPNEERSELALRAPTPIGETLDTEPHTEDVSGQPEVDSATA